MLIRILLVLRILWLNIKNQNLRWMMTFLSSKVVQGSFYIKYSFCLLQSVLKILNLCKFSEHLNGRLVSINKKKTAVAQAYSYCNHLEKPVNFVILRTAYGIERPFSLTWFQRVLNTCYFIKFGKLF